MAKSPTFTLDNLDLTVKLDPASAPASRWWKDTKQSVKVLPPPSTFSVLDPYSVSPPRRSSYDGANARLTEGLSKPLHHFSDTEMVDLVKELDEDNWLARERAIHEIVVKATEYWRRDDYHGTQAPMNFSWTTRPGMVQRIVINLPRGLPDEYVLAFIERMVRDQIEEG